MKKICKCGHNKIHHQNGHGECFLSGCMCTRFRNANKIPGVRQKYCQDTPPPDYSPSSEPEPIHW